MALMADETESELTELLAKLVAMPTVSADLVAACKCADFAEAYLTERGMHVARLESNGFPGLVATSQPTKQPKVLLQAHLDVVPGRADLFDLQERAGRLVGRGTFDMKFAGAVFLQVVDALRDDLTDYDFGVMLSFDEEIGGKDGVRFLLEQGYRSEVCILPDGGQDWQLETGHKGAWLAKLTAKGRAAHGSRPWEGDNAIHRLIDALHEIKQLFKDQDIDTDSFSVNMVSGGDTVNKVADWAEASIDIRFLSNAGCDKLQTKVGHLAKNHGVTVETLFCIKICEIDLKHPLVRSFIEIAEQVHGRPLGRARSLGTSDAHWFADLDIPTILIRPEGGEPHSNDEWISQEGLEKYYRVIKTYIQEEAKVN
jgi:succinyl-diaminopimelate desuccinylase